MSMDSVQQRVDDAIESFQEDAGDEGMIAIGGIQALTTIDFPGKIAAVFFTKGCPWNCRYCHNAALRVNGSGGASMKYVERFLVDRVNFLDGIVLSGGEPTFQKRLPEFLEWVRSFGYATAIHTNGFFPSMLQRLILKGLVDYIAMDIKAPPKEYYRVTGSEQSCIAVARSIDVIISSGIDYEFRTTYHPHILTERDLIDIVHAVSAVGAKKYFLQRFRSRGVEDAELTMECEQSIIPESVASEAGKLFDIFAVR